MLLLSAASDREWDINPSKLFCRFVLILLIVTLVAIVKASFSILIKLGFISIILYLLSGMLWSQRPHPKLKRILKKGAFWYLDGLDEIKYTEAQRLFQTQWFQVLRFISDDKHNTIMVLNDQITF